MNKRLLFCLLMLLPALLLTACSQSPPRALVAESGENALPIYAQPEAGTAYEMTATLYFRYESSAFLRAETRTITVLPNETREKALVEALLDGPASTGAGMTTLFPKGTEVLSTQAQGDTLFVTFNETLYNRYSDEPASLTGAKTRYEAALRRNLAMAALTATLTESGEYACVQVLVRPESAVGESMRLKAAYFLEDSELPCDSLTRREEYLPTPANAARAILDAWQARDWDTLYLFISTRNIAGDARPAQSATATVFARSGVITQHACSCGSVSPDGQSAVVCADFALRGEGGLEAAVSAWPLHLTREDGVWKASMTAVRRMMRISEE